MLDRTEHGIYPILVSAVIMLSILTSINRDTGQSLIPFSTTLELSVVGLVFMFAVFFRKRVSIPRSSLLVILPLVLLFLFAISSTLWAEFPRLTLQRSLMSFGVILAIFVIVLNDYQPDVTFYMVSWGIVLTMSILSIVGIMLFLFGDIKTIQETNVQYLSFGPIELTQNVVGGNHRISSLFGNPNTLAGYLVVSIPLTVGLYIKYTYKRAIATLAIIQLIALVLTYSRTGAIATATALFTLFILLSMDRFATLRSLPSLSVIFVVTALTAFLVGGMDRLMDVSLESRADTWTALWNYTHENPLGTGFGISNEVVLMRTKDTASSAHSDYFAVTAELGILGLLFFSTMLLLGSILCLKNYLKSSYMIHLATGFSVFLGLTVHGIAETTMIRPGGRQILWSYVFAFVIFYMNSPREP